MLEEAGQTGRPPEIEVRMYNTKEDFGRASLEMVEARGRHDRIKQPISDRAYVVLEGEGEFFFADEEGGEVVAVARYDVAIVPKNTVYDYRGRMRPLLLHAPACEQDSGVHLDGLWD